MHVLTARAGCAAPPPVIARYAFDPARRRSSVVDADGVHVVHQVGLVLPGPRDLRFGHWDFPLPEREIPTGIPLSTVDAERVIHGLRCAPLLFGPDARPRLPEDAIIDVLLRVSRLAEVLPEVVELDLNPVVSTTEGCLVLDARIRVRPRPPVDPFLRRLRA